MKHAFRGIKVFDWVLKSVMIGLVVLGYSGLVRAADEPGSKKRRAEKSRMVEERDEMNEEESGVIEIVVKIPKPEALIFSRRMETKYQTIGYEKGFTDKIIDSAKHSPF